MRDRTSVQRNKGMEVKSRFPNVDRQDMTILSSSRVAVQVVHTGSIGELKGDSVGRARYNREADILQEADTASREGSS